MSSSDYVSLHNHTTYSIMDSLIKPSDLFKRAKELGQSAIAVTDHGTMSGAWDCLKASKEAGVKLIMGCEFYFLDDIAEADKNAASGTHPSSRLRHIILLAKNAEGYRNLLTLNKEGNEHGIVMFKRVIPRIDWKMLESYNRGVICTTACGGGILSQLINTRKLDEAKKQAQRLKDIFGESLALEIQPHGMRRVANLYKDYEDQRFTNYQLVKIGDELGIKVIVATDAHYVLPEDHSAHDCMLAIGSGQPVFSGNRLRYSQDFHIKSREEVVKTLTSILGNFKDRAEEFCDNTLVFANMCEQPDWIDPKVHRVTGLSWELPDFPVKDQPDYKEFQEWWRLPRDVGLLREDDAYLRYLCENNFDKYFPSQDEATRKTYLERMEKELDILSFKNLSSYMLIVADYVNWAKSNGIPVGPGRGSVAGFLVAYLLNIHTADPIKYGLIAERFYSKVKQGASDIDLDFSQKGKPLVEEYIFNKYGKENCAKITNYMMLTPKPYAKSISRVFQYGGDAKSAVAIGNAIAESIPKDIKSVKEALTDAPLFMEYANSVKYGQLAKFAEHIGNKVSARATHAAGVIICGKPLHHIVPVRKDKDGCWSVEYEKERAEANGLIKMDILGLSTLDIIDDTFKLIKERNKTPPSVDWNYDENDVKAYELISKGDTYGIFQFGTSAGTIDLCKRIQPKCMEDLAAITALTRPGVPKEFRNLFLESKFSNKKVELLHPCLERSLQGTYGIPVFDECMLTLGEDVAGWDLNESDRLRKFIKDKGKHPEKDEKLKKDFIASTARHLNDPDMAKKLWEEMFANFNAYLFNKAHAITYSFISYQTAYLKAHFPLEFLVANLTFESKSTSLDAEDNVLRAKNEIRKLKVDIVPPDINKSEFTYKIIDDRKVITGLDSLKYLGKDAVPEILAKRPFKSFEDFLSRVDGKKVRAPAVQALAASGCLDSFGMTRKQMFLYASDYKKKLAVWLKKKNKGENFNYPWPEDSDDWSVSQKYALERYYIGEGLSGNKFQAYPGFFNSAAPRFAEFPKIFPDPGVSDEKYDIPPFQAEIMGFFEFKVKKENSKSFGKPMAKVTLQDPYGTTILMTVFPKQWADLKDRIKILTGGSAPEFVPGIAIFARGSLQWYEGDISIIFEDILKCTPPPPLPSDLKPKKVSMRVSRSRKNAEELDKEELLEQIEDELIEDGVEDLGELEEDVFDFTDIDQLQIGFLKDFK